MTEDPFEGGDSRTSTSNYEYNKQQEVLRRKALDTMYARNMGQMEEEEFLLVESKRLQESHRKLEIEREAMFRLLNGGLFDSFSMASGKPSLSGILDSFQYHSRNGGAGGGDGPRRMKKKKTSSADFHTLESPIDVGGIAAGGK